MVETVKLTLQIITGTEGSCKKVMIKLSPSTATKRENIIELLNQRIPLLFLPFCSSSNQKCPNLISNYWSFPFSSSISNLNTFTNQDLAINGRIDQI